MARAICSEMPATASRSSTLARLTALAVPKWRSRARFRVGPMPSISSSGLRAHLDPPPRPVRADGEAVRLVAQPLHEIEHRVARLQHERLAAGHEEGLAAGVAVRPLGDADERQVGDAELGERLDAPPRAARGRRRSARDRATGRASPASAAAPSRGPASLEQPREAPAEHLAHHAVVVAGREVLRADVELAVLRL